MRFLGVGLLSLLMAGMVVSCGDSGTSSGFTDVAGIPAGNGAGSQLSGNFTVIFEVTSDGCKGEALAGAPNKGTSSALEVKVEHSEGTIEFKDIVAELRGGVTFDNDYDVGGAKIGDAGGDKKNVLQTIRLSGKFSDKNTFSGNGEETLEGRVQNDIFNCSFSFKVSGIRKE